MTTLPTNSAYAHHHRDASAPAKIAGYQVIERLGSGAASDLYLVIDSAGERFALKHVLIKDKKSQRFLDQAVCEHRIAQTLSNPRIRESYKVVKVRSALGRVREVAVIMEYVQGKTLEALASSPAAALYRMFFEAAAALHVMHEAGVVHADLKPSNIMVCRDPQTGRDQVKIIDLGQSCAVGTVKQRIQGTPDYIAPEQVKRQAVDARTDVYCFGATMYKLVTGQKASNAMPSKPEIGQYAADSGSEGPLIPALQINPQVPPALSTLLSDCLEPKPADRPADMRAVMDRLELVIAQSQRRKAG